MHSYVDVLCLCMTAIELAAAMNVLRQQRHETRGFGKEPSGDLAR